MDLKYRYFKARNASTIALDRENLASREIRTLEIIQDILNFFKVLEDFVAKTPNLAKVEVLSVSK